MENDKDRGGCLAMIAVAVIAVPVSLIFDIHYLKAALAIVGACVLIIVAGLIIGYGFEELSKDLDWLSKRNKKGK